jgi:hypothetical protein
MCFGALAVFRGRVERLGQARRQAGGCGWGWEAGRTVWKKMKFSSEDPLTHSRLEPLAEIDHLLFPLDAALVAAL